jgi:aryl-alcohol dehydrogenase-like predicted oxidoreductase
VIEFLTNAYVVKDKEAFRKKMKAMAELAKELKCTQSQLAIAWCLVNKDLSTAIIGSTKPEQLDDSLAAIELVKK